MDEWVGEWMDGLVDEWMGEWMDGLVDEWMGESYLADGSSRQVQDPVPILYH